MAGRGAAIRNLVVSMIFAGLGGVLLWGPAPLYTRILGGVLVVFFGVSAVAMIMVLGSAKGRGKPDGPEPQ